MLPGVGAIVGGGLDFTETKIIANRAYKWFFDNDFSVDTDTNYFDNEIDIQDIDFNAPVHDDENEL